MTKVLVVEDDVWLGELEATVLTKEGYEVAIAPHAIEAIERVETFQPDVIVSDMLLAGTTVFAFLHELQSYTDTNTIPVILCTNLADHMTQEQLGTYGVKRVIDKTTMHPSDIVAAVRSVTL